MINYSEVPIFPDSVELGLTPLSRDKEIELDIREEQELLLLEQHYYYMQEMIYRDQLAKSGIEPGDYIH